jgi:hypothetical protein
LSAWTAIFGGILGFLARSLHASKLIFPKFRQLHNLDRSSNESVGWDCKFPQIEWIKRFIFTQSGHTDFKIHRNQSRNKLLYILLNPNH